MLEETDKIQSLITIFHKIGSNIIDNIYNISTQMTLYAINFILDQNQKILQFPLPKTPYAKSAPTTTHTLNQYPISNQNIIKENISNQNNIIENTIKENNQSNIIITLVNNKITQLNQIDQIITTNVLKSIENIISDIYSSIDTDTKQKENIISNIYSSINTKESQKENITSDIYSSIDTKQKENIIFDIYSSIDTKQKETQKGTQKETQKETQKDKQAQKIELNENPSIFEKDIKNDKEILEKFIQVRMRYRNHISDQSVDFDLYKREYGTLLRAGVILISEDKILLVLGKGSGKWGFPKGSIENTDTSFVQTALRELHEETGIDLNTSSLLPCRWQNHYNVYYLMSIPESSIKNFNLNPLDTNEIQTAAWITISEANTLSINSDLKLFLSTISYL